jgi:CBS domain-containing protein/RimJ/RimL family protein N-acetyltransferase
MAVNMNRSLLPEVTSIYSEPYAFIEKRGAPILIKPLSEGRHDRLIRMYLDFQPRNAFSGLPPITDPACISWVESMIRDGLNLVAISFEDGVVGHAAVFPMDDKRCEMLVAVSPEYQNVGIGTQLTRCIIQFAYELEFEKIWLSVENTNAVARHVYQKTGFEYILHSEVDELEMVLDLAKYHHVTDVTVGDIMRTDVVTIRETVPCAYAIRLFLNSGIAALPVLDMNGHVRGILSETDLIAISNQCQKVSDVFTRRVITVKRKSTLSRVIRLFQSRKIRCIPVVDDNERLIGVIGRKEILTYYCRIFGF